MSNIKQLSYQEVCQFLAGKSDLTQLKELEKSIPVYGIFNFIKKYYHSRTHQSREISLTFDKAEDYLEKYLSGEVNKQDAVDLIEAIISSEKNFQKLQYLIEQYALVFSNLKDVTEYENALSNREIIRQLLRLKNKKTINNSDFHFYRKKLVTGILSVAAIFLALFLIPIQFDKDLNELYNFDEEVPLDFNQSNLRGGVLNDEITDPDYKRFKFQFNKGMSEYLAQEYANALNEWENLEGQINLLKSNPNFNSEDEKSLILYNAICRVALYLSEKENIEENEKKSFLNQSIKLFEKLPLISDIEKYHYSLALGLTGKREKALEILSSIKINSNFYNKKIILEEQLKQ